MESKVKNRILSISMLIFLVGMSGWFIFRTPDEYSYSERRVLKQKPVFSMEEFLDGEYGKKYEDYALDQFPLRDNLRGIKAISENYIFNKADNNGIIFKEGHLSKIEYPLKESMLEYAGNRFEFIYKKYLMKKDIEPYFVIVPDKNYYLGQKRNILTMDYEKLYKQMYKKTSYMKHIDIRSHLILEDYYYTDTHWRQEKIGDIAKLIADKMGTKVDADYKKVVCKEPFYGVYVGQSALKVTPDKLVYLTDDTLKKCSVLCYDTGMPVKKELYDMDKLKSKDMYEVFLSGAVALLTIENPQASSDKELIMFRDSFGSSLAPLLVEGYKKITMVDIRYINSDVLDAFIEFNDQDVLFVYSTLLLNSSLGIR
ncbi:MAG: hypothetical protein E7262_03080 [Lachnospiraceae bacterium]|nr:hypothetical protein [Lachnospiraceae bacterium]